MKHPEGFMDNISPAEHKTCLFVTDPRFRSSGLQETLIFIKHCDGRPKCGAECVAFGKLHEYVFEKYILTVQIISR